MEWLTGLDVKSLSVESLGLPLYACSVAELERSTFPNGYGLDRFQEQSTPRAS